MEEAWSSPIDELMDDLGFGWTCELTNRFGELIYDIITDKTLAYVEKLGKDLSEQERQRLQLHQDWDIGSATSEESAEDVGDTGPALGRTVDQDQGISREVSFRTSL